MRNFPKEEVNKMNGVTTEVLEKAKAEVFEYLRSTRRDGVERLLSWLEDTPFEQAPASENDHNSFRGGLVCHTLNTCRKALEIRKAKIKAKVYTAEQLPEDSVILAALLHDTCKIFGYSPVGEAWVLDPAERSKGHGRRSLEILTKEVGFPLTDDEKTAIRWHDGKADYDCQHGEASVRSRMLQECEAAYQSCPLLNVVHLADSAMGKAEKKAQKAGNRAPLHYLDESVQAIEITGKPASYPAQADTPQGAGFTFLGVGDVRLDVVSKTECNDTFTRKGKEEIVYQEVGGSLGTLSCLLSQLGCTAYPIARLGQSPIADRIVTDLERYGVNTQFVSQDEERGGWCLKQTHCFDTHGRHEAQYGVLKTCKRKFDSNGVEGRHASYKPVSSKGGQVESILLKTKFTPNVFYFGDTNLGHLQLAKTYKRKGSVIVFETTKRHDDRERQAECLKISDIVKVSEKDCTNLDALVPVKSGKLLIQTLGAKGVRYNLRGEGWVDVPAPENGYVVDPSGAGDVFLAFLLNHLARKATLKVSALTQEQVRKAIVEAQVFAAYSVSFYGAKGFWYTNPNVELAPGSTEPVF